MSATSSSLFDYDAKKTKQYFSGARLDFVAALPDNTGASIIEIGCGDGSTGAAVIAAGKCANYTGVEIAPSVADTARGVLHEVITGNVETLELPFETESVDAVIMSEVLEHLADPWTVVARLHSLLRPGGLFLASSPNVAHHRIIRNLIAGRWDLTESGPMDRTHLRWFTPRTYRKMFEDAGFEIVYSGPVTAPGRRRRLVAALSGGRLDHLFNVQNNVHARKPKP